MADKKNDSKAISDRVNKVAASQAAKAVSREGRAEAPAD